MTISAILPIFKSTNREEQLIKRTVDTIRAKGMAYALRRALLALVEQFYHRGRVIVIEHDFSGALPSPVIPDDFEHRLLKPGDIDLLLDLVGPRRIRRYRKRIEEGQTCSAAFKREEVVAFCWSSTAPVIDDLLSFEIPVGHGEIYFYDSFTKRSERNRGLFFFLLIDGFRRSKDEGKKKAIAIHTEADLLKVYPRYRENGIPVRVTHIVDIVKVLIWKKVSRREYDPAIDELGLEGNTTNPARWENETATERL